MAANKAAMATTAMAESKKRERRTQDEGHGQGRAGLKGALKNSDDNVEE